MKIQELCDHSDDGGYTLDPMSFRSMNPNGNYEEVITYNELIDRILDDENLGLDDHNDLNTTFKDIVDHIGPLKVNDKSYNGSLWNVKVMKNDGTVEEIPLQMMASIDPIKCARYAYKNRLLKKDGWRRFKRYANMLPNLSRMIHQHQLKSSHSTPTYKFGIQIPTSHNDAMHLDR